jgi:hypothetical protein
VSKQTADYSFSSRDSRFNAGVRLTANRRSNRPQIIRINPQVGPPHSREPLWKPCFANQQARTALRIHTSHRGSLVCKPASAPTLTLSTSQDGSRTFAALSLVQVEAGRPRCDGGRPHRAPRCAQANHPRHCGGQRRQEHHAAGGRARPHPRLQSRDHDGLRQARECVVVRRDEQSSESHGSRPPTADTSPAGNFTGQFRRDASTPALAPPCRPTAALPLYIHHPAHQAIVKELNLVREDTIAHDYVIG